jgi:hypothetical protein
MKDGLSTKLSPVKKIGMRFTRAGLGTLSGRMLAEETSTSAGFAKAKTLSMAIT